jgi:hypothetical protein
MSAATHTLLGGFSRSILRADLIDGDWRCKTASRATGTSEAEAFAAALALAPERCKRVWLLSDEWFHQTMALNPAQVAGLNADQLERALAFETEPYSGIPMTAAALGYRRVADGGFEVVALPAGLRGRLVSLTAEGFCGIARADPPPEDEAGRNAWLRRTLGALEEETVPIIGIPATPPSSTRFRTAAIVMEIAALLLLTGGWIWLKARTAAHTTINSEHAAVSNELNKLNRQSQAAAAEIDKLRADMETSRSVAARRLALASLLQSLAIQRPDGVVLRKIDADGPSSSAVSGVSLTPDAIDEMSIVLKETLRNKGWSVFPGRKNSLKKLPNGGPWEFSLTVVHEEAAKDGVHLGEQEDIR